MRIGVPTEFTDHEAIEPGVRDAVHRTIELCRELGAEVGECSLPHSLDYGVACYYLIAPAEASSNLARYDGVRFGYRSPHESDRLEMYKHTRDEGFGDEPKRRILVGTYALSAGYYDAYYGQAQKVRTVLIREHAAAFERFDVLLTPTSPTVAFELGAKSANPLAMYLNDLLTIPSCMAGLPGLNVPCGLSEGLPVGVQLIGPQFSENTLFRVGYALEQAIGFDPVPGRLAMRFEDPAADFIPAVERVFGATPRVLDGSRAVLVGEREAAARGRRARALADRDERRARAPARHGRGRARHRGGVAGGEGEAR